ncbi:hypothetical protein J5N97_022163 [Dioscorea zingiberensis]|uniref:Cytochrome P450 n=1 Tax=Dioscorea zingiberensis TaxID=325984 RepID=A0A9D5HAB5_9LILI|nr:hypothetical protein J5N97_022163 [Dioscorea zingiberensis]
MAYEFLSSCSSFLITLLLLIVLLKSIKLVFSKRVRLPPSPWKLPLLGNLHQVGSLPHQSLHKLAKKHGPLMIINLGQVPTLVVSSSEMARETMKTHDLNFANRPHFKAADILLYGNLDMNFAPYGDHWRKMRKISVTNLLSARRVQSLSAEKEAEVAQLMDKIISQASSSPSGALNLSDLFRNFTLDMLYTAIMGKLSGGEEGRNETFRELIDENLDILGGFSLDDFFPSMGWLTSLLGMDERAKRTFRKWDAALSKLIQEHLTRNEGNLKADNFVDILLSLQKDPNTDMTLTDDHVKALLMDIFVGATDTTNVSLEWGMAELIRNPQVMKKLQNEVRGIAAGKSMLKQDDLSEMHYLKAVIKENLRLHPPAPFLFPRETVESCEIEGYHIPAKTRVIINFWSMGRDPKVWDNPEEFQPERFVNSPIDFNGLDYEYIPFGAGRRVCPGIQFAVSTLYLALANLVNRFDWKLPDYMKDEKEIDMTETAGPTMKMKTELHLVPEPRF